MNIIDIHISNLSESQKENIEEVEIILSASIYDMHEHLLIDGKYKGYTVIRWKK